jgi:hypothetical protein
MYILDMVRPQATAVSFCQLQSIVPRIQEGSRRGGGIEDNKASHITMKMLFTLALACDIFKFTVIDDE